MTRTMWLIAEDEATEKVIQSIFRARKYNVRVNPRGQAAGISSLAQEVSKLIMEAKRLKQPEDCIVVIHDADIQTQPDRKNYETVKRVCERDDNRDVLYVVAHDEIESWLMADAGLCKWLGEKPRNFDEQRQPSLTLNRLLKERKDKVRWNERYRDEVLKWVDGTGNAHSPSMSTAFQLFQALPCLQPETT